MYVIWCLAALVFFIVSVYRALQSIPVSDNRRRLADVLAALPTDNVVSFTATSAAGATISVVSNVNALQTGMTVTGGGLSPGATILEVDAAAFTVLLSSSTTVSSALVPFQASWALTSAQVHLYAAAYSGGNDPTPASFTEATFDTYAYQSMGTTGGVYTLPDGSAKADFGLFSWILSATPATPNTIYGYWIDYLSPINGTRVVLCWENAPSPIVMDSAGAGINLQIPMTYPDPDSAVWS